MKSETYFPLFVEIPVYPSSVVGFISQHSYEEMRNWPADLWTTPFDYVSQFNMFTHQRIQTNFDRGKGTLLARYLWMLNGQPVS